MPVPPSAASSLEGLTPLTQLLPKARARVAELSAPHDDAVRLKSLGLCIGRRVEVIKGGDPLVVCVQGGRLGISARLAHSVLVRPT